MVMLVAAERLNTLVIEQCEVIMRVSFLNLRIAESKEAAPLSPEQSKQSGRPRTSADGFCVGHNKHYWELIVS